MRTVVFSALVLALVATPVLAEKKLLEIIKLDGSILTLTDADLKLVGEVTIETPLVGDDKSEVIHRVTGPRMADVLRHFSIKGEIADAVALDAYRIDIPVDDAMNYDVVLATSIDGKKLGVRDRGPVWVIYPLKDHPELQTPMYEARSIWQLKELRMK